MHLEPMRLADEDVVDDVLVVQPGREPHESREEAVRRSGAPDPAAGVDVSVRRGRGRVEVLAEVAAKRHVPVGPAEKRSLQSVNHLRALSNVRRVGLRGPVATDVPTASLAHEEDLPRVRIERCVAREERLSVAQVPIDKRAHRHDALCRIAQTLPNSTSDFADVHHVVCVGEEH